MQADSAKINKLIKTARGQLDGVLRMIEEDKYCVDVVNQIMAADAILHKSAREILRAHLAGCVQQAFDEGDEQAREEKIDELVAVLDRLSKNG